MTLEKSILSAIDLTHRLEAALNVGEMDLCQDLMDLRGQAMDDFETMHKANSPAQHAICKNLVDELIAADEKLQAMYQESLDSTAGEFRQTLTSGSGNPGSYAVNTIPACIDRKA